MKVTDVSYIIISHDTFALPCAIIPTERLLRVMGALTPEDRCKVPIRYRELFKKELVKVMKSECGNKDVRGL